MKKFLTILVGLIFIVALIGTIFFLWKKSQKKPVVYATESPRIADIVKKTVATGSVVPRQEVAIKPQISGIIEAILVDPGRAVKKGDLIARIRMVPNMVDLNDAQNRLERARIGLEQAQADFDRNQKLVQDGTIAAATFQTFEIAFKKAQEELKGAEDNLELISKGTSRAMTDTTNTLVRSTIEGMVLEVPVEVGHSVIEANTFNDGYQFTPADGRWISYPVQQLACLLIDRIGCPGSNTVIASATGAIGKQVHPNAHSFCAFFAS